jgi:hypothetical protein
MFLESYIEGLLKVFLFLMVSTKEDLKVISQFICLFELFFKKILLLCESKFLGFYLLS